MTKIFTILCLALMAVSANAQKLQVFKDGQLMAEFYEKDGWEFVFGEDSTPSTGSNGSINCHEYVEIGGVKWATMNLGATTVAGSYETCFGDYFAMGEAFPRYNLVSYNSDTDIRVYFKFEFEKGWSGNSKEYSAANDAATIVWGSNWRTPTIEDFKALFQACGEVYYKHNIKTIDKKIEEGGVYCLFKEQTFEPEYTGVNGVLFVDKKDISKRVFMPFAGSGIGSDEKILLPSFDGAYWTSTKDTERSSDSCIPYVSVSCSMHTIGQDSDHAHTGLSIRPVVK